jgi:type IX secretion system PorP/SprF family membrane protein
MKLSKSLVLSFALLFLYLTGFTQDLHFSQYHLSPLALNPANTGNYSGNWRISNILRSQWQQFADPGYQTLGIGGEIKADNVLKGLNIGGLVIHDRSGSVTMKVTKAMFSSSYKTLIGKSYLQVGLQAGLIFKQFNNAIYGTQFNWGTGQFDSSLPSMEDGIDESINFFDLNAGVLWKRRFGWIEPEIGLAFFHLNTPKEGFTGSSEKLEIRSMYSLSARIILNQKFNVSPICYYQRIQMTENLLGGIQIRYNLERNPNQINYITMGTMIRSGFKRQTDAAIISLGVSVNKYLIGISYDANISDIQAYTNSVGAFELGVVYTGFTSRFNPNSLPCSRE